jgi:hypothetical protein
MKITYIVIGLFTFITSSVLGQTGVSTIGPTKNLDVNGDMRVRSLSTTAQSSADKVLTVDANGNVRQLTAYKNIAVGDMKYGMQQADHLGWYLLNGRNVSTLPTNAQSNAATIGITTTLDNAQNRFVRSNTTIGTGGSATQVLSLAQMPLYNITGTTNASGNHSHTFDDQWFHNYNPSGGSFATLNVDNSPGTTNDRQRYTETTIGVTTSVNAWAHSHNITAPSGGTATAFSIEPQYLTANLFIYLGL